MWVASLWSTNEVVCRSSIFVLHLATCLLINGSVNIQARQQSVTFLSWHGTAVCQFSRRPPCSPLQGAAGLGDKATTCQGKSVESTLVWSSFALISSLCLSLPFLFPLLLARQRQHAMKLFVVLSGQPLVGWPFLWIEVPAADPTAVAFWGLEQRTAINRECWSPTMHLPSCFSVGDNMPFPQAKWNRTHHTTPSCVRIVSHSFPVIHGGLGLEGLPCAGSAVDSIFCSRFSVLVQKHHRDHKNCMAVFQLRIRMFQIHLGIWLLLGKSGDGMGCSQLYSVKNARSVRSRPVMSLGFVSPGSGGHKNRKKSFRPLTYSNTTSCISL